MINSEGQNVEEMSKEEILCHLLQKQRKFYSFILDLTKEEHQRYEEQKPLKQIAPLLSEKKKKLKEISKIETALTPLKKYWKDKTNRKDPSSKSVLSELEKLDGLLHEILDLDLISQKYLETYIQSLEQKQAK